MEDTKTIALNVLDINSRIKDIQSKLHILHNELDELHSMRDELIEKLGKNQENSKK